MSVEPVMVGVRAIPPLRTEGSELITGPQLAAFSSSGEESGTDLAGHCEQCLHIVSTVSIVQQNENKAS